jgi:hypothetical protein
LNYLEQYARGSRTGAKLAKAREGRSIQRSMCRLEIPAGREEQIGTGRRVVRRELPSS